MSLSEKELYVCYHCKALSLKITTYSYSLYEPLKYRTDGLCTNHPAHSPDTLVMFCPHCEKFVIGKNLKRGRDFTAKERDADAKRIKSYHERKDYWDIEKECFPGSKKWIEEMAKLSLADKEDVPEKDFRWFIRVHSCQEILFALKSPELQKEEEIRYKLRLNYWRKKNCESASIFDTPEATEEIYGKLMAAWEGQTDERYLFKAELLRNTGKFAASMKLLKTPLPQYKEVLMKQKKWVKVMLLLIELKHKEPMEINI